MDTGSWRHGRSLAGQDAFGDESTRGLLEGQLLCVNLQNTPGCSVLLLCFRCLYDSEMSHSVFVAALGNTPFSLEPTIIIIPKLAYQCAQPNTALLESRMSEILNKKRIEE
jgi:hypothetical protein